MPAELFKKKVLYSLQLTFEWFRKQKRMWVSIGAPGMWVRGRKGREEEEREREVLERGKMIKINESRWMIYGSSLYYSFNFSTGWNFSKEKKKGVLKCWWEAFLPTLNIQILDKIHYFLKVYIVKFKNKKRKYTDAINQEESKPQQCVRTEW